MFTLRIYHPLSRLQVYILSTLSNTNMFIVRTSDCCDGVAVDIINGTASVLYTNGSVYNYTNVSRRAIANLMFNPNISLGFWINANLINKKRVSCEQRYEAIPTFA